jgi:hypothetical protein
MLRALAKELAGKPHALRALALRAMGERLRSGTSRRLLKVANLILQVTEGR